MHNRIVLVPYQMYSESAKALKDAFGKQLIRVAPDSERYAGKDGDLIINWGCTKSPTWRMKAPAGYKSLNKAAAVAVACNKTKAFLALDLAGVRTVEFTVERDVAQRWVSEGNVVVGRKILTGHSGNGIVLFEPNTTVEDCPLYTKYKKKKHEYRVHVFNGEVIDTQWKRKSREGTEDTRIRNHGNGWVFCREDIQIPNGLHEEAVKAVKVLGLDFGAVDIIWNQRDGVCYVLEVNCAPGITGTTLENYSTAIRKLLK